MPKITAASHPAPVLGAPAEFGRLARWKPDAGGVLEAQCAADLGLGHEPQEQRRRRSPGGAGRQPAQNEAPDALVRSSELPQWQGKPRAWRPSWKNSWIVSSG